MWFLIGFFLGALSVFSVQNWRRFRRVAAAVEAAGELARPICPACDHLPTSAISPSGFRRRTRRGAAWSPGPGRLRSMLAGGRNPK